MKKDKDIINLAFDKGWDGAIKTVLPSDKEVEKWYDENIDCTSSPSSAIYKYRLWLKDRTRS